MHRCRAKEEEEEWVGWGWGGGGVEFGWRIMKSYTECQTEETHRSLVLSCKER